MKRHICLCILVVMWTPAVLAQRRVPAAVLERDLQTCINRGYEGYMAGCTERIIERARGEVRRLLRLWPSRIGEGFPDQRERQADYREKIARAQAAWDQYVEADCGLITGMGSSYEQVLLECVAERRVAQVKRLQSEHPMAVEGL